MSYHDLLNNKCDHCGKVFPAGDGTVNDKVDERGYSSYEDLCQACASELNLGNCAVCGGLLEDTKIDKNFRCPACAVEAAPTEELSVQDLAERVGEGECPKCGQPASWGEINIEGPNAIQVGACTHCGAEFHTVYAFSTVVYH